MRASDGIVFDLQRASIHDGPGLRTTVFLKGCPLRCAWCHNPESQALHPELGYDAARCAGCRACVDACHHGAHRFDEDGTHRVDFASCQAVGGCVAACPSGALRLYGYDRTVSQIMAEVLKDRAYYAASGGGLTLSGGEPTVQLTFCLALLRAARSEGIHTCIETCGIGSREAYAALLPLTDLFLFDYKATNPARHAALTGVSNERILANLRWLHDAGAAIQLRCPVIPGCNDDSGHLRGIAALTRELPRIRSVEILPYHESGNAKYTRTGRPQPAIAAGAPDDATQAAWIETIRAADPAIPVALA